MHILEPLWRLLGVEEEGECFLEMLECLESLWRMEDWLLLVFHWTLWKTCAPVSGTEWTSGRVSGRPRVGRFGHWVLADGAWSTLSTCFSRWGKALERWQTDGPGGCVALVQAWRACECSLSLLEVRGLAVQCFSVGRTPMHWPHRLGCNGLRRCVCAALGTLRELLQSTSTWTAFTMVACAYS